MKLEKYKKFLIIISLYGLRNNIANNCCYDCCDGICHDCLEFFSNKETVNNPKNDLNENNDFTIKDAKYIDNMYKNYISGNNEDFMLIDLQAPRVDYKTVEKYADIILPKDITETK